MLEIFAEYVLQGTQRLTIYGKPNRIFFRNRITASEALGSAFVTRFFGSHGELADADSWPVDHLQRYLERRVVEVTRAPPQFSKPIDCSPSLLAFHVIV